MPHFFGLISPTDAMGNNSGQEIIGFPIQNILQGDPDRRLSKGMKGACRKEILEFSTSDMLKKGSRCQNFTFISLLNTI